MTPSQPDNYETRIEALRTLPRKEYDPAIDALIAELEAVGRLKEYEAVLTEIDKSRDWELKQLVMDALACL